MSPVLQLSICIYYHIFFMLLSRGFCENGWSLLIFSGEESPDSMKEKRRITSGDGKHHGKCNRKYTACDLHVRVKRQGKSLPRKWQHLRQCKPRLEQDQIGMTQSRLHEMSFGQIARCLRQRKYQRNDRRDNFLSNRIRLTVFAKAFS